MKKLHPVFREAEIAVIRETEMVWLLLVYLIGEMFSVAQTVISVERIVAGIQPLSSVWASIYTVLLFSVGIVFTLVFTAEEVKEEEARKHNSLPAS